jgi:hypothetical protein
MDVIGTAALSLGLLIALGGILAGAIATSPGPILLRLALFVFDWQPQTPAYVFPARKIGHWSGGSLASKCGQLRSTMLRISGSISVMSSDPDAICCRHFQIQRSPFTDDYGHELLGRATACENNPSGPSSSP